MNLWKQMTKSYKGIQPQAKPYEAKKSEKQTQTLSFLLLKILKVEAQDLFFMWQ